MVEIIDIYDANQLKIGSIDRNKAHEDGLWHKAFHCWIISEINNVNCLIFQLRSKNSSFPDLLDISAAGHFMKGETKKNVLREVNEELGIKLSFKNLNYLGQRIEVIDFGEIKNREFQDIFLIEIPDFVKLISPNNEEVNGIFWIPIEECIQLFSLEIKSVQICGVIYNANNQKWIMTKRKVNSKHFVPRQLNYYLTLSIMSQRLSRKQTPLSI